MREKITAVLNQIEAQQQTTTIPDDIPIMELADAVVRGKMKLSSPQMRLLIELLPYHAPKLTAVASAELDGRSFAALLDKAIERSNGARLIEGHAIRDE